MNLESLSDGNTARDSVDVGDIRSLETSFDEVIGPQGLIRLSWRPRTSEYPAGTTRMPFGAPPG